MPTPAEDRSDDERLARYATELTEGIEAAVPTWVRRCVTERLVWAGAPVDEALEADIDRAAAAARDDVVPRIRSLLGLDIDDQRENPLAILRQAVRYPTEVLAAAGVPPTERDRDAAALFPDDVYDLTPATFADLDPALREPGIAWGAAKAHVHLSRRRAEGRR